MALTKNPTTKVVIVDALINYRATLQGLEEGEYETVEANIKCVEDLLSRITEGPPLTIY